MIEILKSVLFGIVEGISEWLPISSTGHMILLNYFLPLNVSDTFMEMYLVVIQLGAILAVVLLFWNKLWPFTADASKHFIKKDVWMMWFKIVVACIPAVIVELLWGDFIEEAFYNPFVVAVMLIVVGVAFIIVESVKRNTPAKMETLADITFTAAFIIGMFQLIAAIFPGTSRSGATIIGALIIGVSRTAAAEFTFCLAVPVMFGASFIKLLKFGFAFTGSEIAILLTGCLVSFVVSILVIRFLMGYIRKHDFKIFGWYRIVLGIVVILSFLV